jgi:hypothetical protein
MTEDNREHERKSFLTEMVLECASGKRQVRVTDVSAGGCYVETIVAVQVGEEVKFDLTHPDGHFVSFTGEVAYHFEGLGFGVRFTNLNDEQKAFLYRITGDLVD